MRSSYLSVIFASAVLIMSMSGCASFRENLKVVAGISTKDIEACRKDALVKVLDCDYKTCYENTEKLLKKVPRAPIYARTKDMIAIYYLDPNTTPVGIFFKEIDATHTQVEVASPASGNKQYIADCVFSGEVEPEKIKSRSFIDSVEY
ncbi:MAG: hypothetical protein WC592_07745 [Candidatus Omnitrophota bacterium]|nr:hypothetical protein [Candidatus Omnitrophota bacterium]